MYHEINWTRKPYYTFDYLKSINVDHLGKLLDIVIHVNQKKEYNYRLESGNIIEIKFHVGYNRSKGKVVFFMIRQMKKGKEQMISFYLPQRYDKALIEDIESFARECEIPFVTRKELNPLFIIIPGTALVYLAMQLLK